MGLKCLTNLYTAVGVMPEHKTPFYTYCEKVDLELTKEAFKVLYGDDVVIQFFRGFIQSVEPLEIGDFARVVVFQAEHYENYIHQAEKALKIPDLLESEAYRINKFADGYRLNLKVLQTYLDAYKS